MTSSGNGTAAGIWKSVVLQRSTLRRIGGGGCTSSERAVTLLGGWGMAVSGSAPGPGGQGAVRVIHRGGRVSMNRVRRNDRVRRNAGFVAWVCNKRVPEIHDVVGRLAGRLCDFEDATVQKIVGILVAVLGGRTVRVCNFEGHAWSMP